VDSELFLDALLGKEHAVVGEVALVHDSEFSWIENASVDLVLTDPPFNIARDTNFHTYEKNTVNSYRFDEGKGWDSYTPSEFRTLLDGWCVEFERVLRPGGNFAVFCADEYISDLINALRTAGLKPRRTLTWRKPNAVPVNRKHMMMSACEYVVVGVNGSKATFNAEVDLEKEPQLTEQEIVAISDKAATVVEGEIRKALSALHRRPSPQDIEKVVRGVLEAKAESTAERSVNIYSAGGDKAELCIPNFVSFNSKAGVRLHPTEKPVPLLRYLSELFSKPGDILLDPFAGSASVGEMAMLSGRRAILVERDREFYERGIDRLKKVRPEN